MKNTALLLSVCMIVLSCDSHKLYENFVPIPDDTWNRSNILSFDVNISDTTTVYNLYLYVRNVSRYEFANLYLFVTAHSPDGNMERDTVEVTLADDNGNWLGRGAASIFTLKYPYKTLVRFPVRGIYTFDMEQAMRMPDLKHISDIGLRIEEAEILRQ